MLPSHSRQCEGILKAARVSTASSAEICSSANPAWSLLRLRPSRAYFSPSPSHATEFSPFIYDLVSGPLTVSKPRCHQHRKKDQERGQDCHDALGIDLDTPQADLKLRFTHRAVLHLDSWELSRGGFPFVVSFGEAVNCYRKAKRLARSSGIEARL